MTTRSTTTAAGPATGAWRLDPAGASAEFHVPYLWGLATVSGRFGQLGGTLDLARRPAVALELGASSVDTGNTRRDRHLRSADFLAADEHPRIRFEADGATVAGDTLRLRGLLYAKGRHVPVELDAAIRADGDGFAIAAETRVDQRELGMTWSPLGVIRAPARIVFRGRLVPDEEDDETPFMPIG